VLRLADVRPRKREHAVIAAGVGCRSSCDVEDLVGAVVTALKNGARDLSEVHALYAPDFKREEPSLMLIAQKLGKAIVWLPLGELEKYASQALTSSDLVMQRFGLPSIAETAALAGARAISHGKASARLLGPRAICGGATCALAVAD
jgi:cobalt-precorrin 5A hydrolase